MRYYCPRVRTRFVWARSRCVYSFLHLDILYNLFDWSLNAARHPTAVSLRIFLAKLLPCHASVYGESGAQKTPIELSNGPNAFRTDTQCAVSFTLCASAGVVLCVQASMFNDDK